MSQGWISLHRKITEHPFYLEKRKFSKLEAWIDLLMMANHKDNRFILGNEIVEVQRGSMITSIRKLGDKWQWSNKKVMSFLKLLKEEGMIDYNSTTKRTLVSIEKYNGYQFQDNTKETESEHEGNTKETQKHTNNNDNNDNNDNKNIYSKIPYQKIIELYNRICNSLPKIQKITDKRKKTIKARWTQYNDIGIYEKLFNKAENSDFLSGRNGKWTSCNFDWLLNENNMIKVLEGNYDNKESLKPTIDKKTRFHTQEQRTSRYTSQELEEIARKRRANS